MLLLDEAAIVGRRLWAELSAGIESVMVGLCTRLLLQRRVGVVVVAAAALIRVMTIVVMVMRVQRIVKGEFAAEYAFQCAGHLDVDRRRNWYQRRRGCFVFTVVRIAAEDAEMC